MLFGLRFEFSGEFKITLAQVPSNCSVAKLRGLFSVLLLDLSLTLATGDHVPLLQTLSPLGFPTFLLFFQALAALLKAVLDPLLFSFYFLWNNLLAVVLMALSIQLSHNTIFPSQPSL